jgi:hypothetical protein
MAGFAMPVEGMFRTALKNLDGGTITAEEMARPAVGASAPELGTAREAKTAREEEMRRTRKRMLDALRERGKTLKKGRK